MTGNTLKPRFVITNRITNGLTQIERARGFLEAATLSEDWVSAMERRALVLEAHHTTHIEGTQLTLDQAERLLAGEAVPEADQDDARELLNYRTAFEFVSEYLDSGAPVTEELIREIHRRLVAGVRGSEAAPGEYRRRQNYVVNAGTGQVIYRPPPASDVPGMMAGLIDWLAATEAAPTALHPVLASAVAQFQLVHIHPFLDGNGRTSRLLSTLCLYRAGYDFKRLFTISEYYDRDRPAFYHAIQHVREAGMDLTGWLEFFVEGLATQLTEVVQRGRVAIRADLMGREHQLSNRQVIALRHLIDHGEIDIARYETLCPDVNRRTLQRDLQQMVEKGIVVSRGSARQAAYVFRL
jgi:Fic family protein